MSKSIKVIIALFSLFLVGAAWGMFTTVSERLEAERLQLLTVAQNHVTRGFYSQAIPYFQRVLSLTPGTDPYVQYQLAQTHKALENMRQYRNILQSLIDTNNVPPNKSLADLYIEAFEHDFENRRIRDVITLLREGWEATGDVRIFRLYAEHRYTISVRRGAYQEAGVLVADSLTPVKLNDLWGFVNTNGLIQIEPQFDLATRFVGNYAIVQTENTLKVINRDGVMQASVPDNAFSAHSITSFDGTNFAIQLCDVESAYTLATFDNLDILLTENVFSFIGLPTYSIRALRRDDGMWRISDTSGRVPGIASEFKYTSIAVDERGRAAVNNRLFVKDSNYYQMINLLGEQIGQTFDEVKPFFETDGLAAVRKGNLWGFVNAQGQMVIEFMFEDAKSSSFNLAPVKAEGLWGYISVGNYPELLHEHFFGRMAIEPQFMDAKQFVNGVAPVKNERGWFYIALVEFEQR